MKRLDTGPVVIVDGAMGTMLQAGGMPAGQSPDRFCMQNPQILRDIHNAYIDAGADIITTCTFGANPFKLPGDVPAVSFNEKLASISVQTARQASARLGRRIFVAGNVGPSGLFASPLGDLEPEEMIAGFARQIEGLAAAGVDLIFIETQFDLAEARACVVAARRVCRLPLMVSMTFENGASLTGSSPMIFAATMRNLGVDVIGTNCSLGPDEMLPVVEELLAACGNPVLAEPNAGLPRLVDGETKFPQGPEEFARKTANFATLGARVLGGCCGTTPAHIACLADAARGLDSSAPVRRAPAGVCLTSRSVCVRIAQDAPFTLIGERINPTGKPWLIAEMQKGELTGALRLADEQTQMGASVLDINSGAPMTDETALLPALVRALVGRTTVPLGLDSSDARAIAAAIAWYPGSCLVNSISGERGRMQLLGPICRDYGAPFILLPLKGARLPEKASERIRITEELLDEAAGLGLGRHLVVVDILALAVSSAPLAAREALEMARWCEKENLATTIGLSNISFGLPARDLLNATFLSLARGAGLLSCIANPGGARLREALDAMSVLMGHDTGASTFIAKYARWKGAGGDSGVIRKKQDIASVYDGVLHGDVENILPLVEKELAAGVLPYDLINEMLIPAITEVGNLYEKREYFLPQLIRSAETMQKAMEKLGPLLEKTRAKHDLPVIVMATVEGDIHDIGKNIVSLLLSNHGFKVVDAGKDVPADRIVACALEHKACIIGLSALMTTTMPRMEDTIKLVRERNLPIRVIVGGAAVTRDFARTIGADAYCEDAVDTVNVARSFLDGQDCRESSDGKKLE